jgi:hypothetical protein
MRTHPGWSVVVNECESSEGHCAKWTASAATSPYNCINQCNMLRQRGHSVLAAIRQAGAGVHSCAGIHTRALSADESSYPLKSSLCGYVESDLTAITSCSSDGPLLH